MVAEKPTDTRWKHSRSALKRHWEEYGGVYMVFGTILALLAFVGNAIVLADRWNNEAAYVCSQGNAARCAYYVQYTTDGLQQQAFLNDYKVTTGRDLKR